MAGGIFNNSTMNGTNVFFHIARQAGFEFVFSSGHALSYPMHTHVSTYTVTVVRRGVVRLVRESGPETRPAGSVYVVSPHEPHRPVYTGDFSIVSLCVDKEHFRHMDHRALAASCLEYSGLLMDKRLLRPKTVQGLLKGVASIYASLGAGAECPDMRSGFARTWEPPELGVPRAHGLSGSGVCTEHGPSGGGAAGTLDPPVLGGHTVHKLPGHGRPGMHGQPHLSPFQRIRRCRRETGLTPHQYAVQCRLREAKKLLTGGAGIAEAAALAGFFDQSHLNRWFNKTIGITPRLYKDSCFFLDS